MKWNDRSFDSNISIFRFRHQFPSGFGEHRICLRVKRICWISMKSPHKFINEYDAFDANGFQFRLFWMIAETWFSIHFGIEHFHSVHCASLNEIGLSRKKITVSHGHGYQIFGTLSEWYQQNWSYHSILFSVRLPPFFFSCFFFFLIHISNDSLAFHPTISIQFISHDIAPFNLSKEKRMK